MEERIEDVYQKKTQLEHILLRPDTYVGSLERDKKTFWLLNKDEDAFEEREIEYVPGLYKIFDEIIVNAADNFQRSKNMTYIKVEIDQTSGTVSVKNNGKGIPVEIHKKEKCYVPDLIFGNLLTGSNFNDDQRKVTGGRNGYGAKLANIFSKLFIVECADKNRKR
jgi:DNA topoisomerase II